MRKLADFCTVVRGEYSSLYTPRNNYIILDDFGEFVTSIRHNRSEQEFLLNYATLTNVYASPTTLDTLRVFEVFEGSSTMSDASSISFPQSEPSPFAGYLPV